jgi:hypothetical protein
MVLLVESTPKKNRLQAWLSFVWPSCIVRDSPLAGLNNRQTSVYDIRLLIKAAAERELPCKKRAFGEELCLHPLKSFEELSTPGIVIISAI